MEEIGLRALKNSVQTLTNWRERILDFLDGRTVMPRRKDEIAKLRAVQEVKLPKNLFQKTPMKRLSAFGQRAAVEPPRELRQHPAPLRYTLMSA